MILAGAILCGCAVLVSWLHELRWAALACWGAFAAVAAIFLAHGAEMVAVALMLVASISAAVFFLHAEVVAFKPEPAASTSNWSRGARRVFPALISGTVGWGVAQLLSVASSAGTAVRPQVSAPFSMVFVITQIVVLVALALAIGAGIIARSGGREDD